MTNTDKTRQEDDGDGGESSGNPTRTDPNMTASLPPDASKTVVNVSKDSRGQTTPNNDLSSLNGQTGEDQQSHPPKDPLDPVVVMSVPPPSRSRPSKADLGPGQQLTSHGEEGRSQTPAEEVDPTLDVPPRPDSVAACPEVNEQSSPPSDSTPRDECSLAAVSSSNTHSPPTAHQPPANVTSPAQALGPHDTACRPPTLPQVGSFRIECEIGRGAMGVVYLGHDKRLNRPVAIKSLPTQVMHNAEMRNRFEREARSLACVNHPCIATIYQLETWNDNGYLILEYVEGQTLAERIACGPMGVDEVVPIARQIAEAIAAAHEKGVVHRDLKPSNIKITPQGTVKVLDFGLAKMIGAGTGDHPGGQPSDHTFTQPGRFMGTPAYTAPEQARGERTDYRTDIWAFGCVLFHMLTAKRPFPGETMADVLVSVLRAQPDWKLLPEAIPHELRALLPRCLEKDPNRRLSNINEALQVLLEIAGAASFGQYELVRQIDRDAAGRVLLVRDVRPGRFQRFVVRTVEPVTEGDQPRGRQVDDFLDYARVQQNVAASGAKYWAPIYDIGKTPSGAYYVTDYFTRSADHLIRGKVRVNEHQLYVLTRSILKALVELHVACGRPHGNLSAGMIWLVGKAGRVKLTHPLPTSQLDVQGRVADLRRLGELLYQLVVHQPLDGQTVAVPYGPAWSRLGNKARLWHQFCNELLGSERTEKSLTVEQVLRRHAPRLRPPIRRTHMAAVLVLGLLLIGAVGPAFLPCDNALRVRLPWVACSGARLLIQARAVYEKTLASCDKRLLQQYGGQGWAQVQQEIGAAAAFARNKQLDRAAQSYTQAAVVLESVRDQVVVEAKTASLANARTKADKFMESNRGLLVEFADREWRALQERRKRIDVTASMDVHGTVIQYRDALQPALQDLVARAGRRRELFEQAKRKVDSLKKRDAQEGLVKIDRLLPEMSGHPRALALKRVLERRANGVTHSGVEFVYIEPGNFLMGSTEEEREAFAIRFAPDELEALMDEGPVTSHKISTPFYISVHEVTVGQFAAFVNASGYRTQAETDGGAFEWVRVETAGTGQPQFRLNRMAGRTWRDPGFKQDDDHPVVCVSYKDAENFCEWLNHKHAGAAPGGRFRLPTGEEWEYVCRAGREGDPFPFFWGDQSGGATVYCNGLDRVAVEDPKLMSILSDLVGSTPPRFEWVDGWVHTCPVRRFPENPWGLYGMHGNVSEWVTDTYRSHGRMFRHVRGGSWASNPMRCRAAFKDYLLDNHRDAYLGFRVVWQLVAD